MILASLAILHTHPWAPQHFTSVLKKNLSKFEVLVFRQTIKGYSTSLEYF